MNNENKLETYGIPTRQEKLENKKGMIIRKIIDWTLILTLIALVIFVRTEGYYNKTYVAFQDCKDTFEIREITQRDYKSMKENFESQAFTYKQLMIDEQKQKTKT